MDFGKIAKDVRVFIRAGQLLEEVLDDGKSCHIDAPCGLPCRSTLSRQQFEKVLYSLSDCSWDEGRLEVLKGFRGSKLDFTADQVDELLEEFSWDEGRVKALRILRGHIDCPALVSMDAMSFDSGKRKGRKALRGEA